MGRGPLKFKQTDVKQAVRAVVAAGIDVREVVIDTDGRIRVITGSPTIVPNGTNEWDSVYEPPAA
jgi:hypothetical protein